MFDFAMFYGVWFLIFYSLDGYSYRFIFLAIFLCSIALLFCFYLGFVAVCTVLLVVVCIFCLSFRPRIRGTFG